MLELVIGAVTIFGAVALLTETLWEVIKSAVPYEFPDWVDKFGAIIVAVSICLPANINLFGELGINIPVIYGAVLTGIICSRGANFLHDRVLKKAGA